ncbi:MAG: hypothetical protein H6898_00410 [Rhodobacter sp.]|nr:hypothetical protein [Rhodobacter sp.]
MWDAEQIDALTEAVVQSLLVDGLSAHALAPRIAEQIAASRPSLPGLSVALPFTLAAGAIDEMLGASPQACAAAREAWRAAALIGADALGLQAQGRHTVADLLAHWHSGDEVFGPRNDP